MSETWWKLPGPSRFVEKVSKDLNDGINVVLSLPRTVPGGMRAAIRSRCENYRDFSSVDFSREDVDPMDCLYERYAKAAPVEDIRNEHHLAMVRSFQRRIIWVEGVDKASWLDWRDFLFRYQEACRSIALADRSLVCLVLNGFSPVSVSVPEEIALVHECFQGVVSHFDMLLFVNHLIEDVSPHERYPVVANLRRDLQVQVVSHLAAWDPGLVGPLLRQPLEEVLEPYGVLKEYAASLGWAVLGNGSPEALWQHGAAEKISGRWEVHSALLALRGEERLLRSRLWKAEIQALLPWIEGERHDILDEFGDQLKRPVQEEFMGEITDVRDLEIGKITHLLTQIPKTPDPQKMRYFFGLKRIRNDLAHHKPVKAIHLSSVMTSLAELEN